MAISQNGWSANDRSVIASYSLPGGSVALRKGDVSVVLLWIANRFHVEVEPLQWPGIWGYAERPIRGGVALSNHASGTAIDLNAPKHPLGTAPTANYTAAEIAKIHEIVAFCEGVIRWGGDYTGRKDGMHFEVNDGQTAASVARIANKIRGGVTPKPPPPPPANNIPGAPGLPTWPSARMPRGHYFGLKTGPAKSHGGAFAWERPYIQAAQRRLIAKGYVPGVHDWRSGWADGVFEEPTRAAVERFQRAEMPGTKFFGQLWTDDWAKLAR